MKQLDVIDSQAHSAGRSREALAATTASSLLTHFIQADLPQMNSAIEARTGHPEALVNRLRPLFEAVRNEVATSHATLERAAARKLLQHLGFGISSVERHFQAIGKQPGAAKESLGHLDDLLLTLGYIGEHPPRDSDTTYWYLNQDCLLSFTGDSQESHFNRVVNLQREVQGNACALLRPVCDGDIEAASNDAARSMVEAASELQRLVHGYRSFMEPIDGGYRFTPDFFMRRMRTYLVSYPVAGKLWSGPNAANLSANMSLDYLTGVTSPWYGEIVKGRWQYLTREDQDSLLVDMTRSSITNQVVQAIKLSFATILNSTPETLARYIANQPVDRQQMIRAFGALLDPVVHATGIHFRLIHEYLIRNANKLTDAEYNSLPIKPNKGTGEMAHGKTRQIMEMRRNHPIVARLLKAIRLFNDTNDNCLQLQLQQGVQKCPMHTK